MAIKWEWTLKPQVGSDRLKKFDKSIPEEAGTSTALAFHWLRQSLDAPAKEAQFAPTVLETVKGIGTAAKTKGYPGVDPTTSWTALAGEQDLRLKVISKGKLAPNNDELQKAIKALDKGTASLLYVYGTKTKAWHALAIDRDKAVKRVFDPFKGQFVTSESKEAADELTKTYPTFDGFAILSVEYFKATNTEGRAEQSDTKTFEQRLGDLSKELGEFVAKVWKNRGDVNLESFPVGRNTIYSYYVGAAKNRPITFEELLSFVNELKKIAGKHQTVAQDTPNPKTEKTLYLSELDERLTWMLAQKLWTEFFHVVAKNAEKPTLARVYVHATDGKAALEIMKVCVAHFAKNPNMWEVKIAAPGAVRLDTIVAYFYDDESAQLLVNVLKELRKTKAALFAKDLPPLVKEVEPGIGTAGEPPKVEIEIYTGTANGTRHSFGSFFSALCWLGLKTLPAPEKDKQPDGRHLIDSVLYSLRLLEIDPKKHDKFPAKEKLEAWYKQNASKMKD